MTAACRPIRMHGSRQDKRRKISEPKLTTDNKPFKPSQEWDAQCQFQGIDKEAVLARQSSKKAPRVNWKESSALRAFSYGTPCPMTLPLDIPFRPISWCWQPGIVPRRGPCSQKVGKRVQGTKEKASGCTGACACRRLLLPRLVLV